MTRDAGYDDFLDAVEAGTPYYLETANGEARLPPLPYDPSTGEADPAERPLPETGTVLTHTTTHIAPPRFDADAPYVTAVADFGPVSLTGQMRETDPEDVEIGQPVTLGVDRSVTREERVLVFSPI